MPGPVARRRKPQGEVGTAIPSVGDRAVSALDGASARRPPAGPTRPDRHGSIGQALFSPRRRRRSRIRDAGAFAPDSIGRTFAARRLSLFTYSLLLFLPLCVIVTRAGRLDANQSTIVLFLGFLPLLNAWADFASTGLTRWRLRLGVQGHLLRNAAIDGIAAVAILLLLAFAIIATVHFIRPADSTPLFDLPALFAGLRETPGEYWWLGFMLFSTLLPTLIHLGIGAFALFTLVSGGLGRPIAAGLMKGDSVEGRFASLILALCAAFAVCVPCWLLWHALTLGGGALPGALLDACEWFYGVLSANFPVTPSA